MKKIVLLSVLLISSIYKINCQNLQEKKELQENPEKYADKPFPKYCVYDSGNHKITAEDYYTGIAKYKLKINKRKKTFFVSSVINNQSFLNCVRKADSLNIYVKIEFNKDRDNKGAKDFIFSTTENHSDFANNVSVYSGKFLQGLLNNAPKNIYLTKGREIIFEHKDCELRKNPIETNQALIVIEYNDAARKDDFYNLSHDPTKPLLKK